ncbi:gamma-secretase-activating protein isoform X1 [Boleophthalmus pectinirostris]|uniref:gamma-secretase-activating protein isoform X1 n=1 Tax=Boleophthalmus pectinirostris TaxID=150288 RepID=UPI00242FDF85|nr:gamma-secretase-activating protein isoform X1 [Boleophthalmus pectinirostris]
MCMREKGAKLEYTRMLKLKRTFDLHRDVVCDLRKKEASVCRVKEYSGEVDARILNIECDGGILYSWKGATGTTRVGKYDPKTKQNKLLYTFDKQVCVSSCSLNKEETLLAVSLAQNTAEVGGIKPVVKCLTLLIEIHPINNTKVLKAVDCRVKVQFLHQEEADRRSVLESHLLLLTEDGYVDLYHILLTRQEGYRVVMVSPERLTRTAERIVEDLCWVQWDGHTQRLYYVTHKGKFLLRCVQFYPNHYCETVLELPLEMPANSFPAVKFVNLGFDHYHTAKPEQELVKMEVFTDRIGSMCICYNHPLNKNSKEVVYTLSLVHKGCSKTFHVSLGSVELPERSAQLHPLFIPIGYYIMVYVKGYFLHLINTRQQEMLCHSLFLSGHDVDLGLQWGTVDVMVVHSEEKASVSLLELSSGRVHSAELSAAHLLQILRADKAFKCPDCEPDPARLAALHCLLVYMGNDPNLELKIIEWLCDGVSTFQSFDHIQEFILASLYRICYEKSLNLDKLLPYSSVSDKKDIPKSLLEIPGVKCTTELHTETIFNIKQSHSHSGGRSRASILSGFWSELQWNTERTKYLEAVPNPRYRTSHVRAEWDRLLKSERRPSSHTNHIEENTKKVLSMVDTWSLDKKVVPLFQEEDAQQRALIGLTVDKLRDHLNRHLPRLGKKKIDSLVVSYVAKLLELIRHMLETVWLKYKMGPRALCLSQRGSEADWSVFHFMFRILEAAVGLCLPLPPGFHTLLAVLAVRCLPHHSFLQYIDHKLLQLTETFVARLMTDLDNSDANEKLKFSILKRLPQPMKQTIVHTWDHPITSASISRDYVHTLLEKHNKTKGFALSGRERPGFRPEFLPLTYLAKMLSDIEEQGTNPFEEQENVDTRFVEETALKQTFILLGFEEN